MSAVSGVPTETNQEVAHPTPIPFCNLDGMLCMWREFGMDEDLTFLPEEMLGEKGDRTESNRSEEVC